MASGQASSSTCSSPSGWGPSSLAFAPRVRCNIYVAHGAQPLSWQRVVKWLPVNNFQEEVVLWARSMSDMLGVSDGVTDDPTGSSWSMGVAMLALFSVE